MIRRDFFELISYAVDVGIGVKFSTNGTFIDRQAARRLTAMDYLDIQISIDGLDAVTNDAVRGVGSYAVARRAMDHLAEAGFGPFKISMVVTRENVAQLDGFKALADSYGAQLRVTRLRPSGRGVDSWPSLHPTPEQQRTIYAWLLEHGEDVLTGDSFFHLNALGEPCRGSTCAVLGRVVCLIDPVGDVYACPFVIHDQFRAGSVREPGGFAAVWRESELFRSLREPSPPERARVAGATTPARAAAWRPSSSPGFPLDGPDPECVRGDGLDAARGRRRLRPPPARRSTTPSPSGSSASPSAPPSENGPPRCQAANAGNQLSGAPARRGSM